MIDQLCDMAVFARVVEAGSFTRAAKELNSTKSTVSKTVTRLEKHLGAKLLRRSTRALTLTQDGQAIYEDCKAIADHASRIRSRIESRTCTPRGHIRISAPMLLGSIKIAPLAAQLGNKYPQLTVTLKLSDTIDPLVASNVDIAVRCGVLEASSLYYRPLKPLTYTLAASAEYLEHNGLPTDPDELSASRGKHNCLLEGEGPAPRSWLFCKNGNSKSVEVQGNIYLSSATALIESAKNHCGIIYLPTYAIQSEIDAGTLQPILADWVQAPTPLSLLYSEKRYSTPALKETLDYLTGHLR